MTSAFCMFDVDQQISYLNSNLCVSVCLCLCCHYFDSPRLETFHLYVRTCGIDCYTIQLCSPSRTNVC